MGVNRIGKVHWLPLTCIEVVPARALQPLSLMPAMAISGFRRHSFGDIWPRGTGTQGSLWRASARLQGRTAPRRTTAICLGILHGQRTARCPVVARAGLCYAGAIGSGWYREAVDEDAGAGGGDRRRGGRCEHAVSPDQEGLVRRGVVRAHRVDRRLHLARGRAAAAFQYELRGRAVAQVLGRSLQEAADRDWAGGKLSRYRQLAVGHQQGTHGRVPQVLRHREYYRRAVRDHRRQGDQGAVAAVRD